MILEQFRQVALPTTDNRNSYHFGRTLNPATQRHSIRRMPARKKDYRLFFLPSIVLHTVNDNTQNSVTILNIRSRSIQFNSIAAQAFHSKAA